MQGNPQMLTNDFPVPPEPITVRYISTWWNNQSCGRCWHVGSWNQKWNIVRFASIFLTQCVKKFSIFSNLHHNHIYSNHNPNLNHKNSKNYYYLFIDVNFLISDKGDTQMTRTGTTASGSGIIGIVQEAFQFHRLKVRGKFAKNGPVVSWFLYLTFANILVLVLDE